MKIKDDKEFKSMISSLKEIEEKATTYCLISSKIVLKEVAETEKREKKKELSSSTSKDRYENKEKKKNSRNYCLYRRFFNICTSFYLVYLCCNCILICIISNSYIFCTFFLNP